MDPDTTLEMIGDYTNVGHHTNAEEMCDELADWLVGGGHNPGYLADDKATTVFAEYILDSLVQRARGVDWKRQTVNLLKCWDSLPQATRNSITSKARI